jgi:hypothetical protein
MGELVPIIVVIFITLVIVVTLLARKNLSQRQVVKPLEEEEYIHKMTLVLTNERAQLLAANLKTAADEAKTTKKSTTVKYFIAEDDMLDIIVDCK